MITGFNTDVSHEDRVFHVQTEDKGLQNPMVESLVYCGGEIITSRRRSYVDLTTTGGYSEDAVLVLMEAQHQALIREIRNGLFDAEGPRPFGHNIISNKSLDEVVLDYLRNDFTMEPIELRQVEEQEPQAGGASTLRFQVVLADTQQPVRAVPVTVFLLSSDSSSRQLSSSITDSSGFAEAAVEIPPLAAERAELQCRAVIGGEVSELRLPVRES